MKQHWILLVLCSLLYSSCNFDDVEDERETWRVYENNATSSLYRIKKQNDTEWRVYENNATSSLYRIKK